MITTYTNCLRIERTDGFIICLTELDKDLDIDDSILGLTGTTQKYLSASGYTPTNMQQTSDNAVNNADVEGVLSSIGVSREDIIGGRYDFAKLHIFIWDYEANTLVKKLGSGHWGETTLKDGSYVAEFRSLSQQLQQTIGRTYNPECDEQLGGKRCTLDLTNITKNFTVLSSTSNIITVADSLIGTEYSGNITTATSTLIFSDAAITVADGTYNGRTIMFTSGNNINIEQTILTQIGSEITLSNPLPNLPVLTDGYEIYLLDSTNVLPVEKIEITSIPTSITSTTQFQDSTLTAIDGTYDGMVVRFTSGANIGEEQIISTYVVGDITVSSAFTNPILVTDDYDIYFIDHSNIKIGLNSYTYGKLLFTSGLNEKLHMEIKQSTLKTFELFLPMPFEINVGDTFTAYLGCDKKISTCKDKFSNNINHQGFPFIPGIDQVSLFGGQ